MGMLQQMMQTKAASSRQRDNDLRQAHQEAFEKIRRAKESPGSRDTVSAAVQELIDACESYITTQK